MGILGESGQNQSDKMKEVISMYEAMDNSLKNIIELKKSGKNAAFEQTRFFRLEANVNKMWKTLKPTEEIQAIEILIERKKVSPMVLEMLKSMGGKIEKL